MCWRLAMCPGTHHYRKEPVRFVSVPCSTRFVLRCSSASWLGLVRFGGSVPRPVPAGSGINRFGPVRLGRFGSVSYFFLQYASWNRCAERRDIGVGGVPRSPIQFKFRIQKHKFPQASKSKHTSFEATSTRSFELRGMYVCIYIYIYIYTHVYIYYECNNSNNINK